MSCCQWGLDRDDGITWTTSAPSVVVLRSLAKADARGPALNP